MGVSAHYLRMLEGQGRIPPARRDLNGRIYSSADLALLIAMGVGQKPDRLRSAEDVLRAVAP